MPCDDDGTVERGTRSLSPIRNSSTKRSLTDLTFGLSLHQSRNKKGQHHSQPAGGHAQGRHEMESDATPAQLAAVAGVSLLALAVGMIAPANWLNLRLSARDVGGAIMPPGMIVDRDTPAEATIDMAAVNPREIATSYGLDVHGNRELAPHTEDGVKVFDLDTGVIRWTILPGVTVDAYAFNGQVPGPRLHFRQGALPTFRHTRVPT